ncbi:MAG TPA: methyltransferase domain-containing protein [Nocardioides sp.]|nr:methyltransferase domain-containing protein [Nocardioides sp.]
MTEPRRMDWQAWHRDYDDPASPVSRRLVEVRSRLAAALDAVPDPVRLLNLCAGDARDTVPVLAATHTRVDACAVELDARLAEQARRAAAEVGVALEVRTGDAADPSVYADRLPVDVLMLIGVLGNISDTDGERTVRAAASMLSPGGTVLWTRSNRFRSEPTHDHDDPAEWVRDRFEATGFETVAFVVPDDVPWRLGVSRLSTPSHAALPERLFSFVR